VIRTWFVDQIMTDEIDVKASLLFGWAREMCSSYLSSYELLFSITSLKP